ncbi:MAG: acyl carrier protein [Nitrospira sp.]|nr:acyl carrier protein [Nitrospira sp.]
MSKPTADDETRTMVLRILSEIAPEADTASLQPDVSFRDQLDLDSMDFLNFVVALHKEFHLEIPEADYPHYMTLNGCLARLSAARS